MKLLDQKLTELKILKTLYILELLLIINQFKMKKSILLLALLFSFSLIAQRSLRIYNLNVKRGYESNVVDTFSDFAGGETRLGPSTILHPSGYD